MKTDQEIAQSQSLEPIANIAEKLDLSPSAIDPFGHYKAKLPLELIQEEKIASSKLVLVSAISPTPAGEGKTTVAVGLNDGLARLGKRSLAVLREPSLGPVFGMKGGATGGGYAQLQPMADINLHFNGDFSAVEKAHNLLAALLDNHLHHRLEPLIDPRTVVWKRVMDMNDRSLRQATIGLGGTTGGVPRETGFDITAASEVMAILCLSRNLADLKERLGRIFLGFTYVKEPVYAGDIQAVGAMAALLEKALQPNLVQSLEGNPALLHGGPFANIAQGTNSLIATQMGMSLADYVVTEAGFGFDLGGEKFLDIKARHGGISPQIVVLVVTVRALKYHGGTALADLNEPDPEAVRRGKEHLARHLANVRTFGLRPLIAINAFPSDSKEEQNTVHSLAAELEAPVVLTEVYAQGGKGGQDLAEAVVEMTRESWPAFSPLYELEQSLERKIQTIAQEIYGAQEVEYSSQARKDLKRIARLGERPWGVCIAKSEKSFTDDPAWRGAPGDHVLHIRAVEVSSGAGFVVPIAGSILRMPGLPAKPAAQQIDLTEDGLRGLF